MELTVEQQYLLSVAHSQYHACWCSGDFRSMSKHGIDKHSWNIPFLASEELIPWLQLADTYLYLSQVQMPNGSGVRWAECLRIMGTGCRVQVFSLILDSSVGLSAGIQSAGDWVSETLWVRILHSAEEDNLSPFDSKIACLCQSIEINNNKYLYLAVQD